MGVLVLGLVADYSSEWESSYIPEKIAIGVVVTLSIIVGISIVVVQLLIARSAKRSAHMRGGAAIAQTTKSRTAQR